MSYEFENGSTATNILTRTAGSVARPPRPATTPNANGPAELPINLVEGLVSTISHFATFCTHPSPIVSDIVTLLSDGGTRADTVDRILGVTGL